MANPEHVAILKQGVEVWNGWRRENPSVKPDLSDAKFEGANLEGANFSGADLTKSNFSSKMDSKEHDMFTDEYIRHKGFTTNLSHAKLIGADLGGADFRYSDLRNADFSRAHLYKTNLRMANLSEANLSEASLYETDLSHAKLLGVDFTESELRYIKIKGASLDSANFERAWLCSIYFLDVDLSQVKGLDTAYHIYAPSFLGVESIYRSKGKIPEKFLRNVGASDSLVTYARALVGKPIDFYTCFVSYSSQDQDFAERLYTDLQSKGVRCWFAPHDLKIGDRFADRIEESIRTYDKLLVVLSKNSVRSTWVEDECRAALEKENRFREEQLLDKTVLFPIKLDEAIEEATSQWVGKIRRERHIGDFTRWKNHDNYRKTFDRLLRDLKAGV